jgi:uncharacterized protein YbjT (DUF2867 family)
MSVLVCGATGCVGRAVANALRARGHHVIEGARGAADGKRALHVDYMNPVSSAAWAARLEAHGVDTVVNCVGILMPAGGQSFERVHSLGPIELFKGAAMGGVKRVLQVSALGVNGDAQTLATPYLHSKLLADDALAALPLDWAVLRPSLVYGPASESAGLFATLASLPLIGLPGRGDQRVQPVHVFELAEAITRLVEAPGPLRQVFELGGPIAMSYREMLAAYRGALGLGAAVWLPAPMVMMKLSAHLAEWLPQRVFSRDTVRLLERGSVAQANRLAALLGREPSALAHGLAITPPQPMLDLSVVLSPAVAFGLRAGLAFMWLYTAVISAALPRASGVLDLLARCGFEGDWGVAALLASCTLNVALGTLTLLRPTPWLYAVQSAAVVGYTLTAAFNMPELTIDHCGPLVKNLPVLMAVLVLWMARPVSHGKPAGASKPGRPGVPGAGGHRLAPQVDLDSRSRMGSLRSVATHISQGHASVGLRAPADR